MSKELSLPDIVPIQKRNINTELGPVTIKFIKPIKDDESTLKRKIENAAHLKELLKLYDGSKHNKIIIVCEDVNTGISAVGHIGTCMTKIVDKSNIYDLNIDFENDEDEFCFSEEIVDDFDEEHVKDDPNDCFVIINESEVDPDCNNVGDIATQGLIQPKTPSINYSDFKNIIFVSDGFFILTEKSINFLLGFEGNVAVIMPKAKKNDVAIQQLTFESDFEVVSIQKPTVEHLAAQFEHLANKKGFKINKSINLKSKIAELIQYRGKYFQENDLLIYLNKIISKNKKELKNFDVLSSKNEKLLSQKLLNEIVGLDDIKQSIYQALYKNIHIIKMAEKGHYVLDNYKHMAFEGNPGTCKTTMARAVAHLYQEHNIISNGFFECGREDIVGKYLGETSQKVNKLFKMAKGGVIFIDEIGSLMNGYSIDSYGEEALSAIVRHMENSPETMVIIATYPKEMERLLSINPGLKSRLTKIIKFPDYNVEELLKIFESFAYRSGYKIENGYESIVSNYFNKIIKNENFGNGREARKLFEHAIAHLSIEQFKNNYKNIEFLTLTSINNACIDLLKNCDRNSQPTIGFSLKKGGE